MIRTARRRRRVAVHTIRATKPVLALSAALFLVLAVMFTARLRLPESVMEYTIENTLPAGGTDPAGFSAMFLPNRLRELLFVLSARDTEVWASSGAGEGLSEQIYTSPPATTVIASTVDPIQDAVVLNDDDAEDHVTDTPTAETQEAVLGEGERFPIPAISIRTGGASYEGIQINNETKYDIDVKALLAAPLQLKAVKKDAPQVLIVHSHTTESYSPEGFTEYTKDMSDRSLDNARNMVAVGEVFAQTLTDAGISVIHDTSLNDYPSYNGSYTRMLKVIEGYLTKYPSIRCVLDLHRDAMINKEGAKYKVVAEIGGETAAQVMIVAGSAQGGLPYPDWQENLKLALRLQQQVETDYPGLMRPLNLRKERFNLHMTHGSMLLEMGTCGNSLSEAKRSAVMVAKSLAKVLP